jgi:hypothetical protein
MTVTSFLEFRSRIDRSMAWLVLGSCALLLFTCLAAVADNSTGPIAAGFLILITIIILPLLVWTFFGTRYRLTETHLLVRSGPFSTDIKLIDIVSIEPTRSIQSSPAFSRDRFLIRYDRFATVMISPEDRGRFLHEVALRAPHLVWEDEKLVALS